MPEYRHLFSRRLARLKNVDVALEGHGILTLQAVVEFEGGLCSIFPDYHINSAFLYRLLDCVGVRAIRELEGASLWFLYQPEEEPQLGKFCVDGLAGFAPLHEKDGKVFMLQPWIEWSRQNCSHSAFEERTGNKP
jgi:hypothetical protein